MVAGVIPIDLQARERKLVYQGRETPDRQEVARSAREESLQIWQSRWDEGRWGRWTARLIPRIDRWVNRPHGEVNYYLTQLLTGHGLFRAFLHLMRKVPDPACAHCGSPRDDALHTFFECERWRVLRHGLDESVGGIGPDNIVGLMLQSEESWTRVAVYVETVLREKKAAEDAEIRRR